MQSVNALHTQVGELARRTAELEGERKRLVGGRQRLVAEREVLQEQGEALKEEIADLTERLAALHAGVHGRFVNLSLRTLGLVERQLGVIESLEESEHDPERLETLFKLDHFAARMRRNSENLLVLAGAEQHSTNHQGPVPLLDVMRAAISEIERYERVRIQSLPPHSQVAGFAADDISHLVAELLENATAFSPPDAHVELSGWLLESGEVMLSVQDEGIGMTSERMAELNERLTDVEAASFSETVDEALGLGLYVVVRLAARHGVRVQLRDAKQGGVTAVIVLPGSILPTRPAPIGSPATAPQSVAHTPVLPGSVAEANSNALPTRAARRTGRGGRRPGPRRDPGPGDRPGPWTAHAPAAVPAAATGHPGRGRGPGTRRRPVRRRRGTRDRRRRPRRPGRPGTGPAARSRPAPPRTPRPNRARTARSRPAPTAPPPAAAVSMRGPRRSRARPRTRHPRAPDRTPGPPQPGAPASDPYAIGPDQHSHAGTDAAPTSAAAAPADASPAGTPADPQTAAAPPAGKQRTTEMGLPKRTPKVVAQQQAPAAPRKSGAANAEALRRRLGGFQRERESAGVMSRPRSRNVQRSRPSHRRTPTEPGPRERATLSRRHAIEGASAHCLRTRTEQSGSKSSLAADQPGRRGARHPLGRGRLLRRPAAAVLRPGPGGRERHGRRERRPRGSSADLATIVSGLGASPTVPRS